MIFQTRVASAPVMAGSSFQPLTRPRLQRKCACGGTPGPSGECAECKRKRLSLQPKLAVNQPGDEYEQEADRVAEAVVGGAGSNRPSISSLGGGNDVQREDPPKPKTEEQKYKEAAKKVGEAFLETAPGKEIKKNAEELGDAFIATLPGKIITGAAVAGAIATLAATHKELPIGIPEISLDKIKPGLKMKITYEGPVDKPTKVMATFSFAVGGGGKTEEKKSKLTESEKFRAETARMAANQAKFREGLKTPEEKAADQRILDAYVRSKMLSPQQFTPRSQPLSFGVAGEQLGFKPGIPSEGAKSGLGPWSPNLKLADKAPAVEQPPKEEPKKKEEESLQRKAAGDHEASGAPPIVDEVLRSPGQPLDSATCAFMERRFGHDFGGVRIHTDARAVQSTRAVDAHAFTVGRDVVFGTGQYAPTTVEGRKLIAHELTHVVQQSTGSARATQLQRKPAPAPANTTLEESDKSWIKAFGLRKWLKGIISDWRDIQARYEAATAATFHPTEALLMGILTASRSRIDLGEEQIKTELNGDPALLKEFRDAYRKMISVVVPKFASLTGKNPTEVFQAHRREIPEWATPAAAPVTAPKGPELCMPNRALTWADFKRAPQQGAFTASTSFDHSLVTEQGQKVIRVTFDPKSWVTPRIGDAADAQANECAQKVSECEEHFKQQAKQGKSGGSVSPTKRGACAAKIPEDPTSTAKSFDECSSKRGTECNRVAKLESDRVLKHERLHFEIGCVLARKGTAAVAANPDKADAILKAVKDQSKKLSSDSGQYHTETKHGCDATAQATWETNVQGGLTSVKIP